MKKSWMVNSVTHSPICGISACVIGIYSSEKAAKAEVHARIETWRYTYENEGVEVDFDKMAAWFDYDTSDGCRWYITPIEIP